MTLHHGKSEELRANKQLHQTVFMLKTFFPSFLLFSKTFSGKTLPTDNVGDNRKAKKLFLKRELKEVERHDLIFKICRLNFL